MGDVFTNLYLDNFTLVRSLEDSVQEFVSLKSILKCTQRSTSRIALIQLSNILCGQRTVQSVVQEHVPCIYAPFVLGSSSGAQSAFPASFSSPTLAQSHVVSRNHLSLMLITISIDQGTDLHAERYSAYSTRCQRVRQHEVQPLSRYRQL